MSKTPYLSRYFHGDISLIGKLVMNTELPERPDSKNPIMRIVSLIKKIVRRRGNEGQDSDNNEEIDENSESMYNLAMKDDLERAIEKISKCSTAEQADKLVEQFFAAKRGMTVAEFRQHISDGTDPEKLRKAREAHDALDRREGRKKITVARRKELRKYLADSLADL